MPIRGGSINTRLGAIYYGKVTSSHRATCLDNAACETVFSKLKAEIAPDTSYRNQLELIQAIEKWIHFYNERRIQTKLGNQTPLQYEQSLVA
ncbi:IS3 family transposase [Limosilactobacillus portuensis]|uniref:IS3 family transposase n=1 Tax=Limosilactobacillus portuensis TaxID=2742601 RepID=UPI003D7238F0